MAGANSFLRATAVFMGGPISAWSCRCRLACVPPEPLPWNYRKRLARLGAKRPAEQELREAAAIDGLKWIESKVNFLCNTKSFDISPSRARLRRLNLDFDILQLWVSLGASSLNLDWNFSGDATNLGGFWRQFDFNSPWNRRNMNERLNLNQATAETEPAPVNKINSVRNLSACLSLQIQIHSARIIKRRAENTSL